MSQNIIKHMTAKERMIVHLERCGVFDQKDACPCTVTRPTLLLARDMRNHRPLYINEIDDLSLLDERYLSARHEYLASTKRAKKEFFKKLIKDRPIGGPLPNVEEAEHAVKMEEDEIFPMEVENQAAVTADNEEMIGMITRASSRARKD
jgi:hypothetical protein